MTRFKRLFAILDTHTGKVIPDLFFNDKQLAKAHRKKLNGDESNPRNLRFVVTLGPDHKNYKDKGDKRVS